MAGKTQVLRVTGGATCRDRASTRRTAGSLRQLAVTTEDEVRRVMPAWLWKARNVFTRQRGRVGEPNVTGGTRFTREVEMGRIVSVAIDALSDDCVSHGHPRRTALDVARRAIPDQRAVGRILGSRRATVRLVREAPVARPRSDARLPLDSPLDGPVVARCARRRLRKHRLAWLDDARMARCAEREHSGVTLVRKTRSLCLSLSWLRLSCLRRTRHGDQHARNEDHRDRHARSERRD